MMKTKAKTLKDLKSTPWTWDILSIGIALLLGLGPYILLTLFGQIYPQSIVSQKDEPPRLPASNE